VTFDESVKYLLSLGNEVLAMKLGLKNITRLLAALGDPQNNYFKVQVAGTNGKGSTCAFLEGICLAAGIRTGLATSPHLVSITERVRINGRDIGKKDFARFATKIRETSESLVAEGELEAVPTFFEQVTAIALYAFAKSGVELAILETGLGGRLDAATAAKAEIAVITQIDYDHQEILGHTLGEIAAEKAAIIRPDSKVIVAPQRPEAAEVIEKFCAEKNVSFVRDFKADVVGLEYEEILLRVDFRTAKVLYPDVHLGLRGRHQVENAGTAILAAETLSQRFPISLENIIEGLRNAKHKGRLEIIGNFIFDGAHNAAGAKALRAFLEEFIGPVTLVFGAMRDKDLAEITGSLFPMAETLILTRPASERSVETRELRKYAPAGISVFECPTVGHALGQALDSGAPEDIVCITGSLYLVGEARKIIE
jgi:dihydrofolate synthase/folylpolyglutamate synthase